MGNAKLKKGQALCLEEPAQGHVEEHDICRSSFCSYESNRTPLESHAQAYGFMLGCVTLNLFAMSGTSRILAMLG